MTRCWFGRRRGACGQQLVHQVRPLNPNRRTFLIRAVPAALGSRGMQHRRAAVRAALGMECGMH